MANGHAIALSLVPELASDHALNAAAPTEIEQRIGAATAAAATLIAFAVVEQQQNGRLDLMTKNEGAERIAKLARLQLDNLGKLDFAAVAHREGKVVLRQYLDADFYQRHSAAAGDAVIDRYIGDVLAIVGKVVALERSFAN